MTPKMPRSTIESMHQESLKELIKVAVDSGPSEMEYALLNIIAMFNDTMKHFCNHSEICNEEIGSGSCNCGAEAARQTYQEIEMMINSVEH